MLIYLRPRFLLCMFLVITTLAVYWQVGDYQFIGYDDELYVSDNPHVKAGLTSDSIIWSFTATDAANWHPLTWLSHILDVHLFGMNSGRHHLTNVFFHIANTLLLFFLLNRMTGDLWQSSFVAALFALHPLHVESVAQVAERKDVLSTFFWLLTMRSYLWYADFRGWHRYITTILLFILGLMVKPMLVTLPFVLLLLDYWPLGRLSIDDWRLPIEKINSNQSSIINHQSSIVNRQSSIFLEKIPFFILTVALCIVTFFVQKSGGAVRSLTVIPFDVRVANALVSYVSYIWKMILPYNLAFFYPHQGMPPAWQTAASFLLLVCVSFAAIKTVRNHPYFAFGWLWYIGTLVPVIGVVQVGSHSIADRYTYVPLIGIFIIVAWGVPNFLSKWCAKKLPDEIGQPVLRQALSVAAAALLSAFMACTWIQTQYWSDSITLFEHALDVTENNTAAHTNLGVVLQEQGRSAEAVYHFSEVLRIKPQSPKNHNNLGTALEDIGRTAEAIRHYSMALDLNPELVDVHNNIGVSLERLGSVSEAVRHYSEAIRLDPGYTEARNNLGVTLFRNGSADKAAAHFQQVLQIKPDDAKAYNNLGVAVHAKGRIDEALANFQQALRIKPDYADARNNFDKVLAEKEKAVTKAIEKIQEAVELDPANPVLYFNMGNLYRKIKETGKAAEQYKKALSIHPEFSEALNNLAIMYAVMGKYDDAVSLLKKLAQNQQDNAETPYRIACIYARQNKKEESVNWLKKAVSRGYNKWELLKTDRNLDNIRNTPYYKKLIKNGK